MLQFGPSGSLTGSDSGANWNTSLVGSNVLSSVNTYMNLGNTYTASAPAIMAQSGTGTIYPNWYYTDVSGDTATGLSVLPSGSNVWLGVSSGTGYGTLFLQGSQASIHLTKISGSGTTYADTYSYGGMYNGEPYWVGNSNRQYIQFSGSILGVWIVAASLGGSTELHSSDGVHFAGGTLSYSASPGCTAAYSGLLLSGGTLQGVVGTAMTGGTLDPGWIAAGHVLVGSGTGTYRIPPLGSVMNAAGSFGYAGSGSVGTLAITSSNLLNGVTAYTTSGSYYPCVQGQVLAPAFGGTAYGPGLSTSGSLTLPPSTAVLSGQVYGILGISNTGSYLPRRRP